MPGRAKCRVSSNRLVVQNGDRRRERLSKTKHCNILCVTRVSGFWTKPLGCFFCGAAPCSKASGRSIFRFRLNFWRIQDILPHRRDLKFLSFLGKHRKQTAALGGGQLIGALQPEVELDGGPLRLHVVVVVQAAATHRQHLQRTLARPARAQITARYLLLASSGFG